MTILLALLFAADVAPYHAQSIEPVQAHAIEPVKPAREVKPLGPAGMDPAPAPAASDPALRGAWAVSIPGVAWTNETRSGPTRVLETHAGPGASLGTLRIGRGGAYRWRKGHGRLQQVIPRRDAKPGVTYWSLSDGERDYYFSREGGELTLYSPGSNLYAASAKRVR